MNAVATIRKPTRLEQFMGDVLPADQRDDFYAVLPRHISPDRFERALANVLMNNPEMMAADPRLIFREISKVVGLGLMLDPQLGEAYLIMGWNGKTRQKEPQVRIGYKGLIKLAKQSGEILNIYAREVHEKDEIECVQGDENRLIHKPKLFTDRGPVVGYYAAVRFRNGEFDFEPMDIPQVHAIRDRSDGWKAFSEGKIKSTPWSTDEGEMAKKTVLRRLSKRVSQSPELNAAISIEDKAEFSAFDRGAAQVPPPAAPRRQIQQQPVAQVIEHQPADPSAAQRKLEEAEAAGAPDEIVSTLAAVVDGEAEDVVTKESLLAELDDKLSYQGTPDAIEEAYTDFDAEALLSDYEGGVEAARKLKGQHLDRVGPADGGAAPAADVSDFPGEDAITQASGGKPLNLLPPVSDPFEIPAEFKGGGHYQIFIRAAATAAKAPEDEDRLRKIWADTKPQRVDLAQQGQIDNTVVKLLLDDLQAAFARCQGAAPLADDLPPPAPPRAASSTPASEAPPASNDAIAAYTARQERELAACATKQDVAKWWASTGDDRDQTGANDAQRMLWKSTMQRRKTDLPEAEG